MIDCMASPQRIYHQLDDRVRGLSRASFALLAGVVSAVSGFAVGLLMSQSTTFEATILGLTVAVIFYVFNPNNMD